MFQVARVRLEQRDSRLSQ